MELILRTIPFLVISTNAIHQLEGQLIEMNFRVPGILFKGVFRVIFYFLLPYGIMSTIPTQFLSDALSLPGLVHAVCIVVIFTVFTLWFWKFGLRHYKSASS